MSLETAHKHAIHEYKTIISCMGCVKDLQMRFNLMLIRYSKFILTEYTFSSLCLAKGHAVTEIIQLSAYILPKALWAGVMTAKERWLQALTGPCDESLAFQPLQLARTSMPAESSSAFACPGLFLLMTQACKHHRAPHCGAESGPSFWVCLDIQHCGCGE